MKRIVLAVQLVCAVLAVYVGLSAQTRFTPVASGAASIAPTTCSAGSVVTAIAADGTATCASNGSGDASTNASSSVDGEMTLFSSTGGKTLKRSTLTGGLVSTTSGVPSVYAGSSCSAGQYATSVSAAGVVTCSVPGGLVLLESHTASTSSSLDFVTRNATGQSGAAFQSDYDTYRFELVMVVPAADATLNLLVSSNGGSSWASSNYKYTGVTANDAGTTGAGGVSTGTTTAYVSGGLEATNSAGVSGSMELYNPLSTSAGKMFVNSLGAQISNGFWYRQASMIFYNSTTAINAVRFVLDTGNIATGTIRLYGVAK